MIFDGLLALHGPEFLKVYGVLLGLAVAGALAIPRWLRAEGMPGPPADPLDLACLAGGTVRYAEAAAARALEQGWLATVSGNRLRSSAAGAPSRDPLAAALAGLPPLAKWSDVARALQPRGEKAAERLEAAGLMISDKAALELRLWQTLPFVPLLVLGVAKYQVGKQLDRPVEYLTGLLAVTAVAAFFRFMAVERRTRAGLAALSSAREGNDRLRRAPPRDEAALAVALFGTAVLAGSSLSALQDLRRASGDSSDSDSSDGGSGCSGGGCGGCGS